MAAGGFGSGLGAVIGANMAANDLDNTQARNDNVAMNYNKGTEPYDQFGQSFLDPTKTAITGVQSAASSTQGYDQFMSGYTNTPAAQYQLQQADEVQNNSAASKGGLLSGANLRSLSTINNGIVAGNANTAYNEYLAGNNQQFGQLESALGNMFQSIGVGTTATGQQGSLAAAQLSSNSYLGAQEAKNDQSKGSGFGSMFSGLTGGSF